MAQAYTVLLGRHAGTQGEDVSIFTANDTEATIVRDIVVANGGTAAGQAHVYVQAGSQTFHLLIADLEPRATAHAELRQRLAAGDQVRAYGDITAWNVSVTGYRLGL